MSTRNPAPHVMTTVHPKAGLWVSHAREAWLEGADRPEVAVGVPQVELVAAMGEGRCSGLVGAV